MKKNKIIIFNNEKLYYKTIIKFLLFLLNKNKINKKKFYKINLLILKQLLEYKTKLYNFVLYSNNWIFNLKRINFKINKLNYYKTIIRNEFSFYLQLFVNFNYLDIEYFKKLIIGWFIYYKKNYKLSINLKNKFFLFFKFIPNWLKISFIFLFLYNLNFNLINFKEDSFLKFIIVNFMIINKRKYILKEPYKSKESKDLTKKLNNNFLVKDKIIKFKLNYLFELKSLKKNNNLQYLNYKLLEEKKIKKNYDLYIINLNKNIKYIVNNLLSFNDYKKLHSKNISWKSYYCYINEFKKRILNKNNYLKFKDYKWNKLVSLNKNNLNLLSVNNDIKELNNFIFKKLFKYKKLSLKLYKLYNFLYYKFKFIPNFIKQRTKIIKFYNFSPLFNKIRYINKKKIKYIIQKKYLIWNLSMKINLFLFSEKVVALRNQGIYYNYSPKLFQYFYKNKGKKIYFIDFFAYSNFFSMIKNFIIIQKYNSKLLNKWFNLSRFCNKNKFIKHLFLPKTQDFFNRFIPFYNKSYFLLNLSFIKFIKFNTFNTFFDYPEKNQNFAKFILLRWNFYSFNFFKNNILLLRGLIFINTFFDFLYIYFFKAIEIFYYFYNIIKQGYVILYFIYFYFKQLSLISKISYKFNYFIIKNYKKELKKISNNHYNNYYCNNFNLINKYNFIFIFNSFIYKYKKIFINFFNLSSIKFKKINLKFNTMVSFFKYRNSYNSNLSFLNLINNKLNYYNNFFYKKLRIKTSNFYSNKKLNYRNSSSLNKGSKIYYLLNKSIRLKSNIKNCFIKINKKQNKNFNIIKQNKNYCFISLLYKLNKNYKSSWQILSDNKIKFKFDFLFNILLIWYLIRFYKEKFSYFNIITKFWITAALSLNNKILLFNNYFLINSSQFSFINLLKENQKKKIIIIVCILLFYSDLNKIT